MINNLKIIDRRPLKKGEYFLYNASDIRKIVIDDKYNMLIDEKIEEELLKNKYLLFTYLGKGLAREYYSSEIFNVYRELSFGEDNLLDEIPGFRKNGLKKENFYIGYKMSLRNPLIVVTQEGNKGPRLYELNKESREILNVNNDLEKQIGDLIKKISNESKENLTNQMNQLINEDYEQALIENESYNLKKTLK